MNKITLVIILLIIMFLLRIKPFDIVLRSFNTLIHELSHALTALLFGQKIKTIVLNRDFSGSVTAKVKTKRASFFISVAGYTLTSVFGYMIIRFITPDTSSAVFYILIILTLVALLFFVRNTFGIVWILGFISVNIMFVMVPFFRPYYSYILYIYGCILLIENLLSTITLLYITITKPKASSDARNLYKVTKIPAVVWSFLFLVFAVIMFYLSIVHIAEL